MSPFSFLRGIGSNFSFLLHSSMKIMQANRKAPDGKPHNVVSHLRLFCSPMSHKKAYMGKLCCWYLSLLDLLYSIPDDSNVSTTTKFPFDLWLCIHGKQLR